MSQEPGIGSIVAGHRIDALVARGGMGVVYRVTHLSLGTERALKLIAPELAADEQFRARFRREWRTAASIDHPHVVPIHDAGEADGHLYIAMRFVHGTDLRQLVARHGALDVGLAARLISQVTSALDAAHGLGLIHRDIKPANILVEDLAEGPHAYLTDFGLTKHAGSTIQLTGTGHWLGTVDYVAPEQAQGQPVDARTDIYGIGCVLFQALTGEVPYPRTNDVAKIWAHVNDPPPRPSASAPQVPPELDEVVQRAMAKDPDERFLSAGDLGRAAVAAAEGRSPSEAERTVARGEAAVRPRQTLAAKLRRRSVPYAATGLVLALLLAAAAILGMLSDGGGTVVTPAANELADYRFQVGEVCSDLNRLNRQTARRAPRYRRRLQAAKDLQALRELMIAEAQHRSSSASALRAHLAGLNPPTAQIRARQRATVGAYGRNIARVQAYRDSLKGVQSYAGLRAVATRFDGRRTVIERDAERTRAGLQRLGGLQCDLEIPPPPKPVFLPDDPTATSTTPAPPPEAPAPDTQPAPTSPAPDVQPAPDVDPAPQPDVNPPAAPSPPPPDANPPAAGGGED